MNIHFDPEELRRIFIEVIKKEFKSNVESTLSQLSRNFIEEELRTAKETVGKSLSQLQELKEEVKQTFERVNSQCGKLNAELTGISVSARNPEDSLGLVEKTTLRQVVEETHFDIKTLKAEIQDIRAEMQSTAEEKKKTSEPVPGFSSLPLRSTSSATDYVQESLDKRDERDSLSTEGILHSLPQLSSGDTFDGKTIVEISAEAQGPRALIIEIVNYLDLPLENFQLHLPYGKECMKAPSSICSCTREVFTFCGGFPDSNNVPEGVISYRIGGTNVSLHSYFAFTTVGVLAMGYLPVTDSVKTIYRPSHSKYVHKRKTGSFESLKQIPANTTEVMTVNDNDLHARGTFILGSKAVLTIEIFRRKL